MLSAALEFADWDFKMGAGSAATCLKFPAKSGDERGVGVDPSSSSQAVVIFGAPNWAKVDILREVLGI
jgi:hypothetical protein